jgi:hypothetical protein
LILRSWAARHGVPFGAILELETLMGVTHAPTPNPDDHQLGSEGRQQSLILLEAGQKDIHLFRNNVGALPDKGGRYVRYGLANESKKQNDLIKSADLIGWEKVKIEPWMNGYFIARFLSVEVKEEGWVFTGDEHEQAQQTWADLVTAGGGRALFATGPGSL